ncbi:Retrovirus-related Pol polyprotein from transposon RE1 [Vitis vinifera]|uniref:Retrovirus-related Pol polyprotein from transposon RE1 n=1 Tax=Vitis vinifera TaxID=29760 RepID=A0A438FJE4_VITVI|nr:Retrovirus-related Pol polyprotein from transposon RE1 [Vitis vinifera]
MNEYLLKIHGFVDLLALVGVNLSMKDHIDAITNGLPKARIEKHSKRLDSEIASVNITQGSSNFGRGNFSQGRGFTSNNQFTPNFGRGNFSPRGRGGFQGRGGFNNGGRRSWNTWNNNAIANAEKLVCQVCMKIGHFADRCYYRYDPSFQGPRTPGASNHVTANANNLVEHTPYYGNEQVRVGNGMGISIKHIGLQCANCQVSVHVSDLQSQNGSSIVGLWHDRLGHPFFKIVQTVMSLSERKHRHIVENGLTLLARASMPFKYWDESFRTVVFLHNRLPSPVSHASSPSLIALILPVNTTTHLENCQDSNAPIVSSSIPSIVGNTHSMITKYKKGIFKPKVYSVTKEPQSADEALQNENWKIAMIDEYSALLRNNTWSLVDLLVGRKVIGCKWIFRVKENLDGSINKYKARLVAKGFHQTTGFDYTETFSPVVKPTTIRVVLTIALSRNWKIQQLDINNAFLNGDLQEEVYMEQPKGFIEKSTSHLVCKLYKSLYGLKQAPHAWFEKLYEALVDLGFTSTKSDQSLFTRFIMNHTTFLLVYVDDILVTGNNPCVIQQLISQLNKSFSLKDLGEINYFLGIQVKHTTEGLHLSQTKYVHDLLCKAKMNNANGMNIPMISGQQLTVSGSDTVKDIQLYRSVVGALQYVTITRPEISFCVNRVCQYLKDP